MKRRSGLGLKFYFHFFSCTCVVGCLFLFTLAPFAHAGGGGDHGGSSSGNPMTGGNGAGSGISGGTGSVSIGGTGSGSGAGGGPAGSQTTAEDPEVAAAETALGSYKSGLSEEALNQSNALDINTSNANAGSETSAAMGMLYTLKGLAMLNSKKGKEKAGVYLSKGVEALHAAEELSKYAAESQASADRMKAGTANESASGTTADDTHDLLMPDPSMMSSRKAEEIYKSFDSKYDVGHEEMIKELSANGSNTQKMEDKLELRNGVIGEAVAAAGTLSAAEQAKLLGLDGSNTAQVDPETAAMIAALKKEADEALGAKNPDAQASTEAPGSGGTAAGGLFTATDIAGNTGGHLGVLQGPGAAFERVLSSAQKGSNARERLSDNFYLGAKDTTLFERVRKKYREREKALQSRR